MGNSFGRESLENHSIHNNKHRYDKEIKMYSDYVKHVKKCQTYSEYELLNKNVFIALF